MFVYLCTLSGQYGRGAPPPQDDDDMTDNDTGSLLMDISNHLEDSSPVMTSMTHKHLRGNMYNVCMYVHTRSHIYSSVYGIYYIAYIMYFLFFSLQKAALRIFSICTDFRRNHPQRISSDISSGF